MLSPSLVALAGLAYATLVAAQSTEVIHSSVIISRNGERYPLLNEESDNIIYLTPLGAQQNYAGGAAFRERYVTGDNPATRIVALSEAIDASQVYATTVDDPLYQFYPAAAQAFMQGLYPPSTFNGSNTLQDVLANGSIINPPLGGYQYAWIHSPTVQDPDSVFVQGYSYCPNFEAFVQGVGQTSAFTAETQATSSFYKTVGQAFGDSSTIPAADYYYSNAYLIWDYLSYQYTHDASTYEQFNTGSVSDDNTYGRLRALADQHEWSLYANLTHENLAYGDMISTIGGQTMTSLVLGLLLANIGSEGVDNKLNVIMVEYPMFLSWFALANLPANSPDFMSIPDWGSTMVFELYSNPGAKVINDGSNYPNLDELYVRFLFQNGTNGNNADDTNADLVTFPLFGTGNNQIKWSDFQTTMEALMVNEVYDWCLVCDSWEESIFCPAFDPAMVYTPPDSSSGSTMSPKIAGVIGAIATLAAVGLFLILVTCIGGLRFTRVSRQADSSLGGFKGGQKLASDPDLTVIKGPDASVQPVSKERVSSWELKNSQAPQIQKPANIGRPSIDDDDRIDPFADPVKPREHV